MRAKKIMNVLIVGGSSEIAVALEKKYNELGCKVLKTRNRKALSDARYFYLDLSDIGTIQKFVKEISCIGVSFDHILFVAALSTQKFGLNIDFSFGSKTPIEIMQKFMCVNCFGYVYLTELLYEYDLISKSAKLIYFSSLAGSITLRGKLKHNKPGGNLPYRLSKSSLNCFVKNLSYDRGSREIIIALHPGYVRTAANKSNAAMEASESADMILDLINNLTEDNTGKFYNINKQELEW